MTINERIRHLRKNELNMTQQVFSTKIKISRSNIGNIETGEVSVTDRTVNDICDAFGVNENWLRYGEGDIFITKSREEEIAEYMAAALKNDNTDFTRRFISAISKLDEFQMEALFTVVEGLANKKS